MPNVGATRGLGQREDGLTDNGPLSAARSAGLHHVASTPVDSSSSGYAPVYTDDDMAAKPKAVPEPPKFWFGETFSGEGYSLGTIVHHDPDTDNMQVKLHPSEKVCTFHASVAKPVNPANLDGVDDNTQLMHLHEPSLLHNIRCRYAKDLIYTYTGYIMIAVNPYKTLGCYSEETMRAYRGKSLGVLAPHLYAMADRAFRSMKVDGTSQSILVSGESGSGKTESCKIMMKYLAMCGTPRAKGDDERRASAQLASLSDKVLDCNPLLEVRPARTEPAISFPRAQPARQGD